MERVVKELGITSHAFIGPAFSSKKNQITPVKSGIEDQVSEFYKELEKIDAANDVPDTPENDTAALLQKKTSPYPPSNAELQNTDDYQDNVRHRVPIWPHCYQNEPYSTRRTRLSGDLSSGNMTSKQRQWRSFPSKYNISERGLCRPQYHQSYLQDVFCGTCPGLSRESHFQEFLPPNIFGENVSMQEYPQHFENNNLGFDQHSDHRNRDWNRNTQHDNSQPVYEWNQKYEFKNEWQHSRPPDDSSYTLILMRGLPGSGKSTLARELLSSGHRGVILSTDDYFAHKHGYSYNSCLIGEAHQWNQRRVDDAMQDGCTPIVIDNTNIQAWEMKPYVKMALERGYKVDFCEPKTRWKFDPSELERRNKHGVSQEKITQMLSRFSFPISIDIVMSSEEPPHVTRRGPPDSPHVTHRGPPERPHVTPRGPPECLHVTPRGPPECPHVTPRGPPERPHVTPRGPPECPHVTPRGPPVPPHVTHRGPLDSPHVTPRGPPEPPHVTHRGPPDSPHVTPRGPPECPHVTHRGPPDSPHVTPPGLPEPHM